MRCFEHPWTCVIVALSTYSHFTNASSTTRNPIGAISEVQNATIHTHSHRITALSDFELSFSLRNELDVKFHLEPNHNILSEDATVSFLSPDGTVRHAEPVDRLDHKVYKGSAWIRRTHPASSIEGENGEMWRRTGWARLSVLRDGGDPVFEGAFSVDFDSHHIQTTTNYLRTKHDEDPEPPSEDAIIVWRDSDILSNSATASMSTNRLDLKRDVFADSLCQADELQFNLQPDHPVYLGIEKRSDARFGAMDFSHLFGKRQIDGQSSGNGAGVNLVSSIGSTSGCPTTHKVALVGVATDCTYTAAFNSTQSARENVISQINQASGIWENTFNISLGLQNLTLSDATCPGSPPAATQWNQACSSSVGIQERLNFFSAWRGNQVDNNSHWTLLSTCATGSAVGLAWLGQACVQSSMTSNVTTSSNSGDAASSGSETVAGANFVVRTQGASEWQIIAHETGHTYGAVHDCTSDTCANSNIVNSQQCCPLSSSACDAGAQYIMNPSTSYGINHFSPCSIGNICNAIGRNSVKTTCLSNNKQVSTISGQQCGNGIVEPGEDCDCGGTSGCGNNACCDASTCKFKNGAVCDDSNEDCCHSCKFASNGTVCRASTGVCDPQEVCSGSSPTCPADKTAQDGNDCGGGLQCASGHCTSRDQQCKTVMGSYTQGNDTYACDSSSCVITCSSPEFGANVCYGLQQNFLDGTKCGGGGSCQNGRCTGTSTAGQISSWVQDHKGVVIGVCVAIGVLLFLALMGCLYRCFFGRRVPKRAVAPPAPNGGWQGWNGRPGPQMSSQSSQGFFGPSQQQHPIPPPPVVYGTGRSVRYA